MSRRDDVSKLYRMPSVLGNIEKALFVIDVIAAIIALSNNSSVISVAIIIQIASAILYFITSVVDDGYFWYEAEKARRKNCIENGFSVRLSELETEEYYNNHSKGSMEKYALNTLESNLFSKEIAGKMLLSSCIKACMAVVVLVIACRFIANPELLLIISQTAFSSYVLLETVMIVLYKLRMDNIYDEGYAIIISPGFKGKAKNATLLAYVVEYEAIKAHYKIRLSGKTFNKYNKELSEQWKLILSHKEK